jgi:hypothetical protein
VQVHPRVAWQLLDGRAVLIDLERATALGLNDSASFLWQRLDGRDAHALAGELAGEFELEPEQARRDVDEFLGLLRARGFLAD